MSKALRIPIFYLPIFVGLILWELTARAGLLNPSLFPSLSDTLAAFVRLASKGQLLDHAALSLFRQSSGFFLAAFFGILSGMLMAESRWVRIILEPLLRATFPLPKDQLLADFHPLVRARQPAQNSDDRLHLRRADHQRHLSRHRDGR